MFAPAGINIDAIPNDPRFQLNPDDQNTDLDKIVSSEGTPQGGDAAALYTYVAMQEGKSGTSPRGSSDGHPAKRRSKSAQDTPSPGSVAIHAEGQEQTLPIHQREEGQTIPNTQAFTSPYQYSAAGPSTQSRTRGLKPQSFTGTSTFRRQSINAAGALEIVPLRSVPEVYQTQNPSAGMGHRPMSGPAPGNMHGVDAYRNMPGMMGTAMDVDGMNSWWNQSYGTFDMEVVDPNANVGSEEYQFQSYSFPS